MSAHDINWPLMRQFKEIRLQTDRSQTNLSMAAGCGKNLISAWEKSEHSPSLFLFEACLNEMGYELAIIKKGARTPPSNDNSTYHGTLKALAEELDT